MLPDTISQIIEQEMVSPVTAVTSVSGGDINQAAKIKLKNGQSIFVKWHNAPPPNMFSAEAFGLRLLAQANGLKTPEVIFEATTCLALEWLERGSSNAQTAIHLGEGLAQQHHFTHTRYGLELDNYCGLTPQINNQSDNWVEFFATQRLAQQKELAAKNNRLPKRRADKLNKLIAKLPQLLPATPPASLLHGDLWGGNWMVTGNGQPALIDPAVYFGHREADLAFTELFGGFPPPFYQAYRSAWPLEPGYNERKEIYNLYHLLNHLNLFGESYGRNVDTVLNKYV